MQVIAACLDVAKLGWADESKMMKQHTENVTRERVLLMERVMLHSLGFYLTVDHIEEVLWSMYEVLIKRKVVESESLKNLLLISKTIVRLFRVCFSIIVCWLLPDEFPLSFQAIDSLATTLCLQFEPLTLGVAMVLQASMVLQDASLQEVVESLVDGVDRNASFAVPDKDVRSILDQLLHLYEECEPISRPTVGV